MSSSFVLIAAMRRSGSTLLTEVLTCPPEMFVFHEPQLALNRFRIKAVEEEALRQVGVEVRGYKVYRRRSTLYGSSLGRRLPANRRAMRDFSGELVPAILERYSRVGVKEINLTHWRLYLEHFPGMQALLTGRDPRDIFLSSHQRVQKGLDRFAGGFSAETLARVLNRQFRHQREIARELPVHKVRLASAKCLSIVHQFDSRIRN